MKAFSAILTGKRASVRVDKEVGRQRRTTFETFATLIALKRKDTMLEILQSDPKIAKWEIVKKHAMLDRKLFPGTGSRPLSRGTPVKKSQFSEVFF